MDKPIIVSFRWSAEEMLRAQRSNMRYSPQGRKLRLITIVGIPLFVVLGIAAGSVRGQNFFAGALPFFLVVGLFLALPLFTRRSVLKMYAQMPDRDRLVTYEIFTDRIKSQSEVVSTDMLWCTIMRAHRIPEGFLLYPTDRMFYWLPVHGFQDSADIERLAQITKVNVKQYTNVL